MKFEPLTLRFFITVVPFYFSVSLFGLALAAEQCEPVRPPGLSPQEVEQIVLTRISEAIEIPITRIDTALSVQGLVGTDNALMRYAFVAVYIGDALGIEPGVAFDRAAKAKGKLHPSQSLTIAELQTLAKEDYLSTSDTPYPSVKPDISYKTRRFVASAPSPPNGWTLIKCHHDQFSFQRQDAKTGEISNASVRNIGFEPFKGKSEFLTQVRTAAKSFSPPNMTIKLVSAEIIDQAGPPCALLEIQGEIPNVLAPINNTKLDSVIVIARFCYGSKFPHLGYSALYSHVGNLPVQTVRQHATAFFAGVNSIQ
jgi:hypothetical protein